MFTGQVAVYVPMHTRYCLPFDPLERVLQEEFLPTFLGDNTEDTNNKLYELLALAGK